MKRSRTGFLFVMLVAFIAAPLSHATDAIDFAEGQWLRAALAVNDEIEIPFLLWLPAGEGEAVIRNGDKDIRVKFERRPPGNWHDAMHGFVLEFPEHEACIEAEYDLTHHYRGVWRKGRGDSAAVTSFVARAIAQPPSEFIRIHDDFEPERALTTFICRIGPSSIDKANFEIQFDEGATATLQLAQSVSATGRADPKRQLDYGVPTAATLEWTNGQVVSLSGVADFFGPPAILSNFDGAEAYLLRMEWDVESQSGRGEYVCVTGRHAFTATRKVEQKQPSAPVSPY